MLFKKLVKYIFITCSCWAGSGIHAQSLEANLEAVFNDFELMGMSVHVSAGTTNDTYNFGLRDFNRTLPVNNATHFRIASISKAITALGVIKLYDQDLMDIDEDIATYLGYTVRNPNFPNVPITARMLLSHQSSLQDGSGYTPFLNATFSENPIPNISELLLPGGNFYTTNMWRTESPGSYFAYSNMNYGLLGTLIEAVSNQRFDIFMKTEILQPLGIDGSFNIQDLTNINDLAALYRYQGGNWQPQNDNYEGVLPPPPNLVNYTEGTNGLYFAPQGGLRCTSEDLSLFLAFLRNDGANSDLSISPEALQEMKSIAWDYDGSNGDNYGGLFNRWGMGLQHANVYAGDAICSITTADTYIGHVGEAYGLISDAFYAVNQDVQFSLLINGSQNGYQVGNVTSFYTIEEAIFSVLCMYFDEALNSEEAARNSFSLVPNPAHTQITIHNTNNSNFSYSLFSVNGKEIMHNTNHYKTSILDISALAVGVYFLKITTQNATHTKKIIVE